MQILPGLLSGIALIFCIAPVKPGYSSYRKKFISNRASLDPIDYSLGKKSCVTGYVHGIDNFIVTGFINVTGYNLTQFPASFNVMYLDLSMFLWNPISSNNINLKEDTCTGMQHVPLDQCRCQYESAIIIRVMCNVTAQIEHTNTLFVLKLYTVRFSLSQEVNMTKVYGDASCSKKSMRASTNGGTSSHGGYNGMAAHIFLVTALVCTVTSMVLYG